MRIDLHPRLCKRVARLSEAERDQISEALRALSDGFGYSHRHSGLGVRRLRKHVFECRTRLRWRIVLFAEKGVLTVYDVMTHDEIKTWLRGF